MKKLPGAESRPTQLGSQTFLWGRFLCDHYVAVALPLGSGKRGFVVIESASLDEKAAQIVFTAIDETSGAPLWQAQDIKGRPLSAAVFDDVLAIVVDAEQDYVLGLDVKTGRVRYRYDGTRK
jgi:hypothetical protein